MTGIILLIMMAAAPIAMMSGGDDDGVSNDDVDTEELEQVDPPETGDRDLIEPEEEEPTVVTEDEGPKGPVHLNDLKEASDDASIELTDTYTPPNDEPGTLIGDGPDVPDLNPLFEVNEERLTPLADTYVGEGNVQHIIQLDGGNDVATGGILGDIFEGGSGADMISGSGGNDVLFASDSTPGSASDSQTDTLDGGLGDDTLMFGNLDVAIGGPGADTFKIQHDMIMIATIEDFDATEDMIVFEADNPDNLSVIFQMGSPDGMMIAMSNGSALILEGVTEEVPADRIAIIGIQPTI